MQIVRDLAGYSYGRSDLVRRAMAKKKAEVMAKERQNFVYGNESENVPGCLARGISEQVANKIYDDMTDFAKYAFNKSHAAAYAVVAYQTAYLKYYYPVEFMAALMTSVIDNSEKVAQYIYICRKMGIELKAPDINEGSVDFTPTGNAIRYALSAIKGVGRAVVSEIVEERNFNGKFKDIKDFILRMSGKEANKRVIESMIKAGAFDSTAGTRRQQMMAYASIIDSTVTERKKNVPGQMGFDDYTDSSGSEDTDADDFGTLELPNVGEYSLEEILFFEKEVLGIYISGHPLDAYKTILDKNVTATSLDFFADEETGQSRVKDKEEAVIGGIITAKTLKTTRSNSVMAFLTVEDVYGSVEVLVFPKDYEKHRSDFEVDSRVLISGRVTADDEQAAKLLFSDMVFLDDVPRELWLQFDSIEEYVKNEEDILVMLSEYDGNDGVTIYCRNDKAIKKLPPGKSTLACDELVERLRARFGQDNIKVTDKQVKWKTYYRR